MKIGKDDVKHLFRVSDRVLRKNLTGWDLEEQGNVYGRVL
ncbi:hypothetical protein VIBNISOn1_890027 [Vibrio nigripulchritudo SOn1]|uniref:GCM domain-containing protein n=1 Tax=Vibrio nigripulchritudo SOn1 TaxID=1238450 RepID=A0AAV2VYB0_9VIBR|nr:hypothetical protein VIBNISOn1_890027 [Vibrio nigripulchritudo SOn1]